MGMRGMGMMGMGMGMGAPEIVVDPVIEEEAAAVGDPHLTLTSGESDDLCCESGICKPCPVALLQEMDYYSYYYYESLLQEDEDELGMASLQDSDYYSYYYYESLLQEDDLGMPIMPMGMMGMGMGMGAPEVVVDPVIEEEAAAVG